MSSAGFALSWPSDGIFTVSHGPSWTQSSFAAYHRWLPQKHHGLSTVSNTADLRSPPVLPCLLEQQDMFFCPFTEWHCHVSQLTGAERHPRGPGHSYFSHLSNHVLSLHTLIAVYNEHIARMKTEIKPVIKVKLTTDRQQVKWHLKKYLLDYSTFIFSRSQYVNTDCWATGCHPKL